MDDHTHMRMESYRASLEFAKHYKQTGPLTSPGFDPDKVPKKEHFKRFTPYSAIAGVSLTINQTLKPFGYKLKEIQSKTTLNKNKRGHAVAAVCRALRKDHNLSHEQIARIIKRERTTVSYYLNLRTK